MATRRALVSIGGTVHELPMADTMAGFIPAGGTTGQVLSKNSNTDYDVSYTTPSVVTVTADITTPARVLCKVLFGGL